MNTSRKSKRKKSKKGKKSSALPHPKSLNPKTQEENLMAWSKACYCEL